MTLLHSTLQISRVLLGIKDGGAQRGAPNLKIAVYRKLYKIDKFGVLGWAGGVIYDDFSTHMNIKKNKYFIYLSLTPPSNYQRLAVSIKNPYAFGGGRGTCPLEA